MDLKGVNGCFAVILVIISQYILSVEGIQCYKCIFAPYVYFSNNSLLCKDFDYSDKFITNCPYSTLCMKKNSNTVINGVNISATERDCAPQKLDTQRIQNGKWQAEIHVEEPYAEGCKRDENRQYKTPYVEHCYCRGELCNSGNSVLDKNGVYFYRTLFFSVLGVIVTKKAVNIVFLEGL